MDFKSIQKMMDHNLVATSTNEDGEEVVIEYYKKTDELDDHYKVSTFQSNGWIRVNCYYLDGTVDESFERDE